MSWLFHTKISKSHFYVWYLGTKEADGVRGSAVVLPVMRQLLKDSFKKPPNKATVQISSKGLKLIQTVPAMSRNGRVKMQVAKFQIAASCITYSLIGKAPFDDVVGVVMLVLNPEMNSPMHVHCYRCDSSETAQIMHANIQLLISRPENQRSIVDLEQRFFLAGLLVPRPKPPPRSTSHSRVRPVSEHFDFEHPGVRTRTRILPDANFQKPAEKVRQRMPRRVVEELKSKLSNTDLRAARNSLHPTDARDVSSTFSYGVTSTPPYRLFGDTLLRGGKSRSLDNLAENGVSTDLRGGDEPTRRFSRIDMTKPFGSMQGEASSKPSVRRVSSIRMNL